MCLILVRIFVLLSVTSVFSYMYILLCVKVGMQKRCEYVRVSRCSVHDGYVNLDAQHADVLVRMVSARYDISNFFTAGKPYL